MRYLRFTNRVYFDCYEKKGYPMQFLSSFNPLAGQFYLFRLPSPPSDGIAGRLPADLRVVLLEGPSRRSL